MREYFKITLVWLVVITGFYWFMSGTFDRMEIAECLKWQAEAQEFENYYITPWQKDQCNYHDIKIELK